MKRSRSFSVSQNTVNAVIVATLIAIMISLLGSALEIRRQVRWEREAETRRVDCLLLSQELADVSDYLTRAMQMYVMTGDASYLEQYWSEVNTGRTRETILHSLERLDLPEQEIKLMQRALSNSRLLTLTETRLMRLAADYYDPEHASVPDEVSSYILNIVEKEMEPAQRLAYAQALAFGEEYLAEKAIIAASIEGFRRMLDQRLESELAAAGRATQRAIRRQFALSASGGVLLVFVWFVFYRLTLQPIRRYTDRLREIGQDGRREQLEPQGSKELRLFAREFNGMYREMTSAIEAKTRFFSNLSHDLRTPLHAITECQYLLERTALDTEQARYVSAMESASRALLQTVNDILDLSKLENRKYYIEAVSFDTAAFFRSIAEVFRPLAKGKPVSLVVEAAPSVPPCLCMDSAVLGRILSNLLSNALKFTAEGEVSLRAEYLEEEQILEIRVSDTGTGILPEDRERIFRQFEQAGKASGGFAGTGLGLSICASLVELLEGELQLESEWGRGSVFTVRLPARVGTLLPEAAADPVGLEREGAFDGLRALLVEDNDVNRQLGAELLERMGMEVRAAADGPAAWELARGEAFDLILLDLRMEPWDGFETAARIRAEGRNRDTDLVALSADAEESSRRRARACGINHYLTKPLDIRQLRGLLQPLAEQGAARPAVPAEESPPLVDWEGVLVRLGGDRTWCASLFRQFLEQYAKSPAAPSGDADADALRYHTLKGLCANVGAQPLADAFARLEEGAREGGTAGCMRGLWEEASALHKQTVREMERRLEELEPVRAAAPVRACDEEESELLRRFAELLRHSDAEAKELFPRVERHYRQYLSAEDHAALRDAVQSFRFDLAWRIVSASERGEEARV